MTLILILALLTAFSGIGMSFLVLRRLRGVRTMSVDELDVKLETTRPISMDFQLYVIAPVTIFWHNMFLPKVYHGFEKLTAWMRNIILKIERKLLRLTNYIRGKREMKQGGQNKKTPYWNEINEFKKDLGEEE